jgi:hypothetical protein
VILASAILAVMLPASTSAVAARDRPSFAGTWRLNEDSSEKLGEKMRESFRGRGGPGGGGIGGRGGFGGGRGGFGGRRQRGEGSGDEGGRRGPERFDSGSETLTIDQSATEITIRDADDAIRTLATDGKKVKTKTPRGDEVETSARWKDSKLVVEQNLPRGGRRTETYERASDSSRLYVTVSIEPSGRPPVTARRVYDPTEPPPTP